MKALRLIVGSLAIAGIIGLGIMSMGCGEPSDYQQPPTHDDQPVDPWQPEQPAQPDPGF